MKIRKLARLLLAGAALIVAALAVQFLATGKLARWQASRMSDAEAYRAAAAPNTPAAVLLEAAHRYERDGRLDDASAAFERAANADATRAEAWLGWGRTAYTGGRWKVADQVLAKCVELFPDQAEGHFLRGAELDNTFRLTAARDELARGVKLQPNAPGTWQALAVLDMRLQRYDDAVNEFRKERQVDKNAAGSSALIGWALERAGRHAEAIPELRKALVENPADFDSRFYLAEALSTSKQETDRSEALQQYNRVLNFSNSKSRAYVGGARLWMARGDMTDAISVLQEGTRVNDFDLDALKLLVESYQREHRDQEAARYIPRLQKLRHLDEERQAVLKRIDATQGTPPSLVDDLIRVGQLCADLRRLPDARLMYTAASRLEPNRPELPAKVAELAALMRQNEAATKRGK